MTEKNGGVRPLGEIVGKQPPRRVNAEMSRPSKASCEPAPFARAMLALTAAKRTAQFTKEELQVWHAILGTYRSETINRAVILVVASQERFPELSDLLQECRRIEKVQKPYNPHGGDVSRSLTEPEIVEIAARIGLEL